MAVAAVIVAAAAAAAVLVGAVLAYLMPGKQSGEKEVGPPTSPRLLEDKNRTLDSF